MYYYISNSELYHFGIKGQKWGIRRYQNQDGTLTSAGKSRYGVGSLINGMINRKREREENDRRFRANIHSKVLEIKAREEREKEERLNRAFKKAVNIHANRIERGIKLALESSAKNYVNDYDSDRKAFFDSIRIQRRLAKAKGIKMADLTPAQKLKRKQYFDDSRASRRSNLIPAAFGYAKSDPESYRFLFDRG